MGNETTVTKLNNDQYRTTIPKAIAGALRLKGKDKLEWLFINGELVIRRV